MFIFKATTSESHHLGTFFLAAKDYRLGPTRRFGVGKAAEYRAGICKSRENYLGRQSLRGDLSLGMLALPREARGAKRGS